jgi:hypothetical protein
MELGMQQAEQERVIGSMVQALMNSIPPEQRKGYMLQPRTALTMQGLYEMIMEADGVTPEMLEAQRAKVRLAETFLQTDMDELPAFIQEHDDQIDMEMLQIITSAAQSALQSGRQDIAAQALAVRDQMMTLSTAGKAAQADAEQQEAAVQEVTEAIQALGEDATLEQFVDLVVSMADSDHKLQAVVGLQYPIFDYGFFQELSQRIETASDDEKSKLIALRDRLQELSQMIRQQQEAMAQSAMQTLQDILAAEDVEEGVRRNIDRIDDTFLMVLSANAQAAEERKDLLASARLKKVMEVVSAMLQQSAPPELQFVSDLLEQDSLEQGQALIDAQAAQYGPNLLILMDALVEEFQSRGDESVVNRLKELRTYAASVVGEPTA